MTETVSYSYDSVGNRTLMIDTVDVASPVTTYTNYAYDVANRMTAFTTTVGSSVNSYTPSWDADGNELSNGLGATCSYGVNEKISQSVVGGVTNTYTYNSDGDRVAVVSGTNESDYLWFTQGTTDQMFWSEALPQVLEADAGTSDAAPTSVDEYVYGQRLVADAAMPVAAGLGSVTGRTWYRYDGQNNVRSVANWAGAQTGAWTYDAWGTVRAATGSAGAVPTFGYDGQQQDAGSGLLYLRARQYDAVSGRFVQEDPGRAGDNWYSYASGGPADSTDPCGLCNTYLVRKQHVHISGRRGPCGCWSPSTSWAVCSWTSLLHTWAAGSGPGVGLPPWP